MTVTTVWRFVTDFTTNTSGSTVLDLNLSPFNVAPGWKLDPPKFEKGRFGGSLRHGQGISRSVAQNRILHIPLQIVSSATTQAVNQAIEDLGSVLSQPGILKFQLQGTTNPIFFRTFADPDYATEIRGKLACAAQYQVIELDIEAEPFGYGPRTAVSGSPFTVSNDPAAGGNPLNFDVAGVLGDMPTPLVIQATSTAVTGTPSGFASKWTHIATRSRGTPSSLVNVVQAEAMVQGTNATVTADGAMSGGSKSRISFGTITEVLRLSDTFPPNGTPQAEARGEYRVYARVAKTVAIDPVVIQFAYGAAAATAVFNTEKSLENTTNPHYLDLGLMPVPMGSDPVKLGYANGADTAVLMPFIGLYARRDGGTANLDVDFLYFVPADESTIITKWPSDLVPYVVDGTTEDGGSCYSMNTALDTINTTASLPQMVGGLGFPEVKPDQTNRIYLIRNVDPTPTGPVQVDPITNTTTIAAWYWPRWREAVRP